MRCETHLCSCGDEGCVRKWLWIFLGIVLGKEGLTRFPAAGHAGIPPHEHLVSALAAQIPPAVIWIEEQKFVLSDAVFVDNVVG
jgi:hypothetical protein